MNNVLSKISNVDLLLWRLSNNIEISSFQQLRLCQPHHSVRKSILSHHGLAALSSGNQWLPWGVRQPFISRPQFFSQRRQVRVLYAVSQHNSTRHLMRCLLRLMRLSRNRILKLYRRIFRLRQIDTSKVCADCFMHNCLYLFMVHSLADQDYEFIWGKGYFFFILPILFKALFSI